MMWHMINQAQLAVMVFDNKKIEFQYTYSLTYVHFGSWKNRVTQNLYLQDFANDSTNVVTAVVVIVLCGLGYIGLSEQKKL